MPSSDAPAAESAPLLRRARLEDLPQLWRLDRICFEAGIAYSQREIRRFLEIPGAESVLADAGGELAGFALGYLDPPDLGRVVTLDVDPAFRRHGLGRRLLEAILDRLAAAGAARAFLEVDVRNSGAIAFYRERGFRETRRLPSYYGPGLDAFEMTREVTRREGTRS
jgi:ribosomal-protein-alanine N-acetyltransferase